MDAGIARKDKQDEDVVDFLSSINDLVAEDAVYYNDCHMKLIMPVYK